MVVGPVGTLARFPVATSRVSPVEQLSEVEPGQLTTSFHRESSANPPAGPNGQLGRCGTDRSPQVAAGRDDDPSLGPHESRDVPFSCRRLELLAKFGRVRIDQGRVPQALYPRKGSRFVGEMRKTGYRIASPGVGHGVTDG